MKPTKKLRSRRGTTLAEVLLVVALMLILLGVAVPNIISYSNMIKLTAMNDNARAVAVAVQSKLYAIKNSGTTGGSEYALLNESATPIDPTVEEENKSVRYVCSWDNESAAKQMLLSGAITDIELLKKGYIVVAYDPVTADILYVYYSENQFDATKLFPTADENYLKENFIGKYLGEAAPAPSWKATLPNFSCEWVFDDEMYLQFTMIETPADSLLDKPLGLEVFAMIPKVGGDRSDWDEVLIYAEGFFATNYETTYAGTIAPDHDHPLTLRNIQKSHHLRFALDSLVTEKAGYGAAQSYLRHQTHPEITSAAEDLLYPREPVANWFNGTKNPYLTVFNREYSSNISDALHALLWNPEAPVTNYIPVDKSMMLKFKLHVLSDETRDANEEKQPGCKFYKFDDDAYTPVDITSENMSPYFYALSNSDTSVYISSMRDYGNLSYVFNDPKASSGIKSAHLVHDISGQQFYDKLVATRYAAIGKIKTVSGKEAATTFMNDTWSHFANRDTIEVNTMVIADRTDSFTIDGKKPDQDGGGNYSISNVSGGGRATYPGGFFTYAENVVFSNIDIVNPRSWRNNYSKTFLGKVDGKLENINLTWESVVSGSLVGIAVNCQFNNVHAYIDPDNLLKVEIDDGGLKGDLGEKNKTSQNLGERRIAGTVVGGLVGLAIGGENKKASSNGTEQETSFTGCSASALLTTEYLFAPSQCVYAGGLVGIAFGDVSISDSYAACSLNGYYSGGLVGVAANGNWKYNNSLTREGTATGTLTIEDSFAAGHIDRLTRVGAGLIACVDYKNGSEKPSVSGCYSAVQWDALSPVAYGTFPGDKSNYYVSQTDLSLPITANVEAHFKVTSGDVIAKHNESGIPCTMNQLEQELNKPLSPEGSKKWGAVSKTSRWRYTEGDPDKFSESEKGETYPFPMLATNNKFWGDWINKDCYNTTGTIDKGGDPTITFDDYICLNYVYILDWGRDLRHVNTGAVISKDGYLHLYVGEVDGKKQAMVNGNTIDSLTNYSYWANEAIKTKTIEKTLGALKFTITVVVSTYGQGIDGATTVTLENNGDNYKMYGAAFYDPDYDPIAGYSFKPTGTDINLGTSQLNWDYYGFYCTAKFGNNEDVTKYYIQFDEKKEYDFTGDNNAYKDEENHFMYVDKTAFTDALKYKTFELATNCENIQLIWKDGYFQVTNKEA